MIITAESGKLVSFGLNFGYTYDFLNNILYGAEFKPQNLPDMKKITRTAAAGTLFLFIVSSALGQHARDPITNIYKVGGSAEIYMAYNYNFSGNDFSKHGVLDVPSNLNTMYAMDSTAFKFIDQVKTAAVSGDFNGDGIDEVVTICNNGSGGIKITIPLLSDDLLWEGQSELDLNELNTMDYKRLRICAGNFDRDIQDEFVICYGKEEQTLRVALFETDADLNITMIDNFKEISYYDHFFDITSGDTDGDGIDEVVMVKNKATMNDNAVTGSPPVFHTKYDLNVLKFDSIVNELYLFMDTLDLALENPAGEDNYYKGKNGRMIEMRVACGDLDADGMEEIVVGWSNYYSHRRKYWCTGDCCWGLCWTGSEGHHYYYCNRLFVNSFDIDNVKQQINNSQVLEVTYSDFGSSAGDNNTRIALSLKCEKMDNVGRDEVLVSNATKFCVLGSTGKGMELEIVQCLEPSTGYLNLKGNESFIVADLNPDTATLDFNKEVVLLLSDQPAGHQIGGTADLASFELLQIEQVNADTLVFSETAEHFLMPFDEININATAFLTGEFDLQGADLYMIGTPEVIRVSELQYPLVILNAPPVHFDVLDGEIHDLCNAYLGEEQPQFIATYFKEDEVDVTTKFEAANSMGFSADFRAYAMAGGSGFESSVKTNWEKGKSFYRATTNVTTISNSKDVNTEDFVLYSLLNYTYYKYPIYNASGKIIGNLAVLNPETEFTSKWGGGNAWHHPGYSFNHESGNLLSYMPYKCTYDFCDNPDAFAPVQFEGQSVSESGGGGFSFTSTDITSEGSSYSFSGGVGASLFVKVGVEGSITTGVKPFGIGADVTTDFRAGVSSELSASYSRSSLSSRTTELTSSFKIEGFIGKLKASYGNVANYNITPYIYRSQSGAIVLDYMIDFEEGLDGWWETNYGQKPDLAFILPWRYAVEKGSDQIKPSMKQRTREIQFYPPYANPGDTVTITTRVHNYSLQTYEDWLDVKFYICDPEMGGVELTDISGEQGVSKYSTMMYGAEDANLDFEEYLNFYWQVPDTVTCSPRIYAVIDPDQVVEEIHENNNKGWNVLPMAGCDDCGYIELEVEPHIANSVPLVTYPTPADEHSIVRFSLQQQGEILLEVFNVSGQRLDVVTNSWYPAGDHEVTYATGHLEDGMYFYRLTSGNVTRTAKLVVSK